uniref:Guanylate cyclase domain-containing protein n=1 Tax=Neobodo designis TaxID=312471 RepID=A0A7S1LWV0_NEODS|mmetsp:Transcript_29728/g.91781  ORF Transcript_29728/g.91781 Transcript_29728/m.91781 type:complete len:314 (+) Transcript_29728:2-943(+)
MAEYLERYHAAVRDVVGRYAGYEVRTAGETCLVVALRPSTALMLAVDVARAIGALETPDVSSATSAASDASFRPSVGIAHGEAEAVTTTAPEREAEPVVGKSRPTHAIDFIGPAVEMALALQDAAVPGEILAESVTARDGMLDVPAGMCSLGRRRTVDVAAENPLQPTVAAYRIEAPGLPRVVPAAGASETPPETGTPAQFGRPLEHTDAALRVEPQGAHHSRARRRRNDVAADVVHILGLLPQKDRDRVRRELQRSIDELHTAGNVSERSRTAAQIIAALPSPPPSPPTSPIGRYGKPDDQPAAALSPHAVE